MKIYKLKKKKTTVRVESIRYCSRHSTKCKIAETISSVSSGSRINDKTTVLHDRTERECSVHVRRIVTANEKERMDKSDSESFYFYIKNSLRLLFRFASTYSPNCNRQEAISLIPDHYTFSEARVFTSNPIQPTIHLNYP